MRYVPNAVALVASLAAITASVGAAQAGGQRGLTDFEHAITKKFPGATPLMPEAFLSLRSRSDGYLLIDVREPNEYAISHIPGAVRVDPNIDARAFLDAFGPQVSGKVVVLYCAVGVRSARLAERIAASLTEAGAVATYNLSGGIFAWHNTGRPLAGRDKDKTDYVHGYSRRWSGYVDFDNLVKLDGRRSWPW